ncbi:MAG TPA: carbon monoxide dehydrogenase subunit G [Bauldia sp.]|nr:carbon monoxide dehydrogenase subunit G [Bauldia sp.]
MEMSGEVKIDAPRSAVWAALNDPAVLKDAIPGCTALTKVSDTEMNGTVEAKVGMVRATFNGKVTLTNVNAPLSYTITGEGKGGVVGFANGGADVKLFEDGDQTILRYTARGQVGGKLAQIGARLIDATAKQMADQFFANLAKRLNEGPLAKAEHAVENAVEHAIEEVVEVAKEGEEEVEEAAVRGFLGGPMVWGLLIIAIGVAVLLVVR